MRPLETVQVAVVALAVLLPVLLGSRLKRGRMAALLVAAMLVQIVVEGFRWQLVPLEAATFGLAAADVMLEERRVRGLRRARRGVMGPVAVAAVAALPVVFPVPELPPPSGALPVGTRTFVLTDEGRQDPYVPLPEAGGPPGDGEAEPAVTAPRRLVVQAWYPAEAEEGAEPAPWAEDFEHLAPALAERVGVPSFALGHLAGVRSHSLPDAAPLAGRFPVVVYVHGWAGSRVGALDQVESLASHGYLVIAADHPRIALNASFPDEVVRLDPAALPDPEEAGEEEFAEAAELVVETLAGDVGQVLDAIAAGASGPFGDLAAHADLDHVGLVGFSAGGGGAIRTCLVDDRCDAVAGLDPWVEPVPDGLLAEELKVPSLLVRSDGWRGTPNDRRLRGLAERSASVSYWVGLEGAGHADFLLTARLSPASHRLGMRGTIDPDLVRAVLDEYLHAFLDRHLLGVGGAPLDHPPGPPVSTELIP